MARFTPNKPAPVKAKTGNKGIISYTYSAANRIQLAFQPISCDKSEKNCKKDFSYSLVAANDSDTAYAQLVCSAILFDLTDFTQMKQAETIKIPVQNP